MHLPWLICFPRWIFVFDAIIAWERKGTWVDQKTARYVRTVGDQNSMATILSHSWHGITTSSVIGSRLLDEVKAG